MNNQFWMDKKVVVTGGNGFLGTHLVSRLKVMGADVFVPTSHKFDLREKENCAKVVKGQNIVIHLAAKVGGIGFNKQYPAEMFYDNILMGVHLLEQARLAKVEKFVALGTICAYPKYTPVPFQEESLWNGYPEETNAPYGLAKKMLLVQVQAYRQQYGFNAIYLLPVNMFGPGDKYDSSVSHVIPALIKKAVEAKRNGDKQLIVWGTGKPTREFLYVKDAVEAIILATEKYNKPNPINVGSGTEISIKDLIHIICKLVGYKGKIAWDSTKPDGQPRRKLDSSKAYKEFGFKAKANFIESLKETIESYKKIKSK
jgi:GDP-L-fucose synthase